MAICEPSGEKSWSLLQRNDGSTATTSGDPPADREAIELAARIRQQKLAVARPVRRLPDGIGLVDHVRSLVIQVIDDDLAAVHRRRAVEPASTARSGRSRQETRGDTIIVRPRPIAT